MAEVKFLKHGYASHIYEVELFGNERDWCDSRVITFADRGRLSEEDWQAIVDGAHPCHFGGLVDREVYPEDDRVVCLVKVYID